MDVKEAAQQAITYVKDLFAEEDLSHVGLEEVEFDESGVWLVTVGFFRDWQLREPARDFGPLAPRRDYKVVHILDSNGSVLAVKNREFNAA